MTDVLKDKSGGSPSKDKAVIIINGKGGAGKDMLCAMAAKKYRIMNISSIDPVKKIAAAAGWDGVKDAKSRKLLSDLKRLFIEYNDLCFKYCVDKYTAFAEADKDILFIHIREPEEISKIVDYFSENGVKCRTLLVKRNIDAAFGNYSDDSVFDYDYDYIFENNTTKKAVEGMFIQLLEEILK